MAITNVQMTTPGERLKRARLLAGIITRREFECKHGISSNTLQSWEQDKSTLTAKGAKRLSAAFLQEGWLCSEEWLLTGNGLPPRHFERSTNPEILSLPREQEAEVIYRESQFFKQNNPNSIILTIADNAMEPFLSPGDIVGGVQYFDRKLSDWVGKLCILELEHNQILPRVLQTGSKPDVYTASCTNPKASVAPLNIYDTKIVSAAPIVWHRMPLRRGY